MLTDFSEIKRGKKLALEPARRAHRNTESRKELSLPFLHPTPMSPGPAVSRASSA